MWDLWCALLEFVKTENHKSIQIFWYEIDYAGWIFACEDNQSKRLIT